MTSERFASLGLSAQNSYDVDSMSAADYLDQKNGTESIGFDANFAIQYGYSIVVMILCLLSASFIIRCIVTEKDSKLIELLMVSVSPLALLLGKILAVMTYVLIMIAMMAIGFVLSYEISVEYLQMASLSTTLSQMGIDLSQLNLNWGTIVIALISLLLAFATYAVLSGLIGTCCNTMEQSEPAIMIVTLLIMVGYIVSCFTPIISSSRAFSLPGHQRILRTSFVCVRKYFTDCPDSFLGYSGNHSCCTEHILCKGIPRSFAVPRQPHGNFSAVSNF